MFLKFPNHAHKNTSTHENANEQKSRKQRLTKKLNSKSLVSNIKLIFYFQKKMDLKPGQTARPMSVWRAGACKTSETRPIFRARPFCLVKRKKH